MAHRQGVFPVLQGLGPPGTPCAPVQILSSPSLAGPLISCVSVAPASGRGVTSTLFVGVSLISPCVCKAGLLCIFMANSFSQPLLKFREQRKCIRSITFPDVTSLIKPIKAFNEMPAPSCSVSECGI